MAHADRPTQISEILETIRTEFPADMAASLETYLTDLESRQPDRPAHITAILKMIGSEHMTVMGTSLEAYITVLEAGQRTIPSSKGAKSRGPERMYWHGVERARQRRERALRKYK